MASIVVQTLGGLGLFLLGMIIMTDNLRSLAGDAMRKLLLRFTYTPLSGAITGTVVTSIMQSSSATTVAAVGMVGAGLMGFTEALGIIFGANIGTTITGWFVVLPSFIEDWWGYSIVETGLALVPGPALAAFVSPVVGPSIVTFVTVTVPTAPLISVPGTTTSTATTVDSPPSRAMDGG